MALASARSPRSPTTAATRPRMPLSTQLVLPRSAIEPGEAVTISYIELAVPPSIRRAELRAGYSFDACARAADDAPNE